MSAKSQGAQGAQRFPAHLAGQPQLESPEAAFTTVLVAGFELARKFGHHKKKGSAASVEEYAAQLAAVLADTKHAEAGIFRVHLTAALTDVAARYARGLTEDVTKLSVGVKSADTLRGSALSPVVDRAFRALATSAKRAGAKDDDDEVTTEEGAAMLFVSRPYFVKLVDTGKIPLAHKTEGGQRRVKRSDVLRYRAAMKHRQASALTEMSEASQELGVYSAPPYRKSKRGAR